MILPSTRAAWLLVLLAGAALPLAAGTQAPRPAPAPPAPYAVALEHYRAHRYAEAARVLEEVAARGEAKGGDLSLLGWCYVQLGRYGEAVDTFRRSLALDRGSLEARQGLAVALAESGSGREAVELATRLSDENPGDKGTLDVLTRVLGAAHLAHDERLHAAPPAAPEEPGYPSRAGQKYLEVRRGKGFAPLFIKGVNLGAALPGKFPAEFPTDVTLYRKWLDQIAAGGYNVVRIYTLLPPAFYQALYEHDRSVAGPDGGGLPPKGFLWLVQGVWTELPDEDRYDDPAFEGAFRGEIDRIFDVLHGNILVAPRRGHASGLYRHDVSGMTLALILGREWEPFSVKAYDDAHGPASFDGRWFTTRDSTAMEAWVASMMDHAVDYEVRAYGVMHPVTFTNWPTLDPLHHPTEATKAEERELAKKLHLPFDASKVREYDNDGVSVDANRIHATARAKAGHFASYHAYPYYPDFMNLDPNYAKARDRYGPDHYFGYLEDLRRYHAGMPVIIAETGVPTSRGIAHVQPEGFDHGGHNEKEQGEIDSRLMEAIFDSGCGGGMIFSWLDEWFKKNWMVIEFEVPADRNPKWHNALDPEQNFGLLAARAGSPGPAVILDGKGDDWGDRTPLLRSTAEAADRGAAGPALRALWAAHDEGSFYFRVDTSGIDWSRSELLVGIDTYGADAGDHRFPGKEKLIAPTGMEFMVRLNGRDSSRVLVDPPYDLFTHRYDRPYRSVPNEDGRYRDIVVEPNRARVGRDGTLYPAIDYSRSHLRFGTTDPESPAYDDLADWCASKDGRLVEVRLPWGLLNVTDPSSHQVVDDGEAVSGPVGTTTTDGFRLYAALVDRESGRIEDTLPARDVAGRMDPSVPALYAWPGWEEPRYHTRLKRSYFILRHRLAALPDWVAP